MFQGQKMFKNMADVEFISRTQNKHLVVFNKEVFDLTQFQNKHPGGASVLKEWKGKAIDNVIFNEAYFRHSRGILQKLNYYKVGYLDEESKPNSKEITKNQTAAPNSVSSTSTASQDNYAKKGNSSTIQQQAQINAQKQAQAIAQQEKALQKEQEEKQKQLLLEQQQQEEQRKQQKYLQEQQLMKQVQQKQEAIAQAKQAKNYEQDNNPQVSSRQSSQNQQQQQSNNQAKSSKGESENIPKKADKQPINKQISIVCAEEKGSEFSVDNNGSNSNKNFYANIDNASHQQKNSHGQDKQTPSEISIKEKLNQQKNKVSVSSERSIGRVKDFLMHAEQHLQPSTIPQISPTTFSQRLIPIEDIKLDPFDDNFDLGDFYNDEQLKSTSIPQSIEFTIFKLHKTII